MNFFYTALAVMMLSALGLWANASAAQTLEDCKDICKNYGKAKAELTNTGCSCMQDVKK